jgi:hypothetical protein
LVLPAIDHFEKLSPFGWGEDSSFAFDKADPQTFQPFPGTRWLLRLKLVRTHQAAKRHAKVPRDHSRSTDTGIDCTPL